MHHHSLIVYFTHTGHTRKLAQAIGQQVDGHLFELLTQTPYPMPYRAVLARSEEELHKGTLPLLNGLPRTDPYDTIFLGTPNWFGEIAPPVQTFLSEDALDGKRVAPFCTNGGGGFGHILKNLERLCPQAHILPGFKTIGGDVDPDQLIHWLRQIDML